MEKLTSQLVKEAAKAWGADLVGIAPISRFAGAPIQQDPRQIMPEAKSVIAVAFRVMRGSLRGVEEGTFFSNYAAMGYGGITYLFMPLCVNQTAKMIEDFGYEAIPYGHQSDWRNIDGNFGEDRTNLSRPVAPGRARPDVAVHLRIAAYLAGLGEIGWSKVFLTPQFGPRQRVGIIITDAELEADPIYNGPKLCNKCLACVRDCPGNAISASRSVKVTLAGNEVEWGELDCAACDIAFRGGQVADAPDAPKYADDMYGKKITRSPFTPFTTKPRNLYNTGQAVCGGRGCMRACMIAMEARGAVQNKFHDKFRRRKPWLVDWSQPEPDSGDTAYRSTTD